MSYQLKINGLEGLIKKLDLAKNLKPVQDIVSGHGAKLQSRMMKTAVFSQGYSTGATKRSIKLSLSGDRLKAKVGPSTHYSYYLEKGTRKMEAQPFVKPSFVVQKSMFINDLKRLFK